MVKRLGGRHGWWWWEERRVEGCLRPNRASVFADARFERAGESIERIDVGCLTLNMRMVQLEERSRVHARDVLWS